MLDYNEDYESSLKYGIKSFLGRKLKEAHDMFGEGEGDDPTKKKPLPGQSTPTQRKQDGTVLGVPAKRPVNGLREYTPKDELNNNMARLKQKRLDAIKQEDEDNKSIPGYADYVKERDANSSPQERQKEAMQFNPVPKIEDKNNPLNTFQKAPTAKFTGDKYSGSNANATQALKLNDDKSKLLHFQDDKGKTRYINSTNFSQERKDKLINKMQESGHQFVAETTKGLTANHTGGQVGRKANLAATQLHYTNSMGGKMRPITVNYDNHTKEEIVKHHDDMLSKGYSLGGKVHSYDMPAPSPVKQTAIKPLKPLAPVKPDSYLKNTNKLASAPKIIKK